jgi:hypothetical protein
MPRPSLLPKVRIVLWRRSSREKSIPSVRRAYPRRAVIRPITPTLVVLVAARLIGVGLSAIRTAAARHALVLDDLAIKVVLGLDNAANEHPAVHAGVGARDRAEAARPRPPAAA